MDTWIQFVDLCRTSDRINLAEKTLTSLVGNTHIESDESQIRAPPPVIFAYYRLAWAKHIRNNEKHERAGTLAQLRQFTETLAEDIGVGERQTQPALISPEDKLYGEYTKLLARCYVELGEWQAAMRENDITADPTPIIADYATATQLDTDWYQAWHTWALANFDVINQFEVSQQGLQPVHFNTYIIPAVEGESRLEDSADEKVSCDLSLYHPGMPCRIRSDCSLCGFSMGINMASAMLSPKAFTLSKWMSGWKSSRK